MKFFSEIALTVACQILAYVAVDSIYRRYVDPQPAD